MRKSILVVGGSGGIGAAVVTKLADAGHQLTVTGRDVSKIAARDGVSVQQFSVEDAASALVLPESLEGVGYCPGTILLKPFHRLTEEEMRRDMEVNFFGAVRVLQAALPALKKCQAPSASVVMFSTIAATTGMAMHSSIAPAKAAVEGLARSLAAEWAPKVRVNVIAPSLTDTPLAAAFLSTDERREVASKRHPLNRVGDPVEIAAMVKFLLDDDSGFITGQVFGIDGGMSSLRAL